ncbi:MAG TPA: hypothetical protein VFP20_04185 [Bacteroidales bacterium]|nr:hypothetical protein [Bacteroidales bacterium]
MSNKYRNRLYNRLINIIHRPRAKVNHQLRARRANGQGIHSPYLFRFVTTVLNSKWPYYAFESLEVNPKTKRKRFRTTFKKKDSHQIQRMIFRIVQDLQPASILEIGNRNGIETRYMLSACPKAICKSITYLSDAKEHSTLNEILLSMDKLDFVLFNAPAERKQRMEEFNDCLQKIHEESLIVIKLIHQTPEQAYLWKQMKNHPKVQASMDLYSLGILFFRSDLPKCRLRIKTQ